MGRVRIHMQWFKKNCLCKYFFKKNLPKFLTFFLLFFRIVSSSTTITSPTLIMSTTPPASIKTDNISFAHWKEPKTLGLRVAYNCLIRWEKTQSMWSPQNTHLCFFRVNLATPLLEECEDDIHSLEMRSWESSDTSKTSKLNFRGQKTSPWGFLHIIGKLSKCRCRKWPRTSHLDICNTSYGKKKG